MFSSCLFKKNDKFNVYSRFSYAAAVTVIKSVVMCWLVKQIKQILCSFQQHWMSIQ